LSHDFDDSLIVLAFLSKSGTQVPENNCLASLNFTYATAMMPIHHIRIPQNGTLMSGREDRVQDLQLTYRLETLQCLLNLNTTGTPCFGLAIINGLISRLIY
jgi:hypothetical protein